MKKPGREALLQVLETMNEGVALIDSRSADWRVNWSNAAFAEIAEMPDRGERSVRGAAERWGGDELVQAMTAALAENASLELPIVKNSQAKPRHAIKIQPVLTRKGVATGECIVALRAISSDEKAAIADELREELDKARNELEAMSDDPVTGLASDERFRQQFALAVASARRESYELALLVFHMDGFDRYLETFGQHATDSCLRMLARTISRRLRRDTDFAGRVGDCHIAILMHGSEESALTQFASTIGADVDALRIHHPRSPMGRYVSMSSASNVLAHDDQAEISGLLDQLIEKAGHDERPAAVRLVVGNKDA